MEHYYSKVQKSKLDISKIVCVLRDTEFSFYTGSGVFSKKKVDKGTELLVNSVSLEDGWSVLDIGCGVGVVGVVVKKLYPRCNVVMTDVNKRAVRLAKMNCELNKVECTVVSGDLYSSVKGKFDTIISNPPQKAGKDVCFAVITEGYGFLKTGGSLQLVARHQKGGKELEKKMKEVFGNVSVLDKKSGYRVYLSKKES